MAIGPIWRLYSTEPCLLMMNTTFQPGNIRVEHVFSNLRPRGGAKASAPEWESGGQRGRKKHGALFGGSQGDVAVASQRSTCRADCRKSAGRVVRGCRASAAARYATLTACQRATTGRSRTCEEGGGREGGKVGGKQGGGEGRQKAGRLAQVRRGKRFQVKSPLYVALCPDPVEREERRETERRETERQRERERERGERDERDERERERDSESESETETESESERVRPQDMQR